MRPLHALLVMLAIGAGVAISATLISSELRSLHASSLLQPTTPTVAGQPAARAPAPSGRAHSTPASPAGSRPAPGADDVERRAASPSSTHRPGGGGLFDPSGSTLALRVALELAGGVLLVSLLLAALTVRRLRRRGRREYVLYELRLSAHDEAKPQDLEDMIEQLANIVRVFPGERVRDGQPYVAFELICNRVEQGMEWSINVRCEPRSVSDLDGAFAAAYPDVRLGRRHAEMPQPRPGALRVPGCVMRFRKERSFVYSLIAGGEEKASPPLEEIARAQVELREPSIVRFQVTPTPSYYEELARRLFRRHEHRLVRHQHHRELPEGDRAEMRASQRTQNRSLFWLETVIAADSLQACKTVAAAVLSRRGENRLHRRWLFFRQGLYRCRFPRALTPLVPSTRSLVSAAEVAHLLALPTARTKGVPVRRLMLPRIPGPPELMRARLQQPIDANRTLGRRANGHATTTGLRDTAVRGGPHEASHTQQSRRRTQ